MAGYRRKQKTYNLVWGEGQAYPGLEVRMRGLSVGELLEMITLMEKVTTDKLTGSGGALEKLFGVFSAALLGWNLEEEDGKPVPATLKGVEAQDLDFVMDVTGEWMTALAGVPPTSSGGSPSGGTSPEERTLGLASLSGSLAS